MLASTLCAAWKALIASRISTEIRVMYFDTDASGVVRITLPIFASSKPRARCWHLRMGMSFEEIAQTKIHPVVVRTEIDYRKPALLGDVISVNGRITESSGARFWVDL